ncbi:hypothetical protein [Streptomyces sp. NPDC058424]|uniref:hypothetical protein n=1 Tax=Streptomyces sp. NPDC058424 TaxID=3346491 RepID=UPI00365295A5
MDGTGRTVDVDAQRTIGEGPPQRPTPERFYVGRAGMRLAWGCGPRCPVVQAVDRVR